MAASGEEAIAARDLAHRASSGGGFWNIEALGPKFTCSNTTETVHEIVSNQGSAGDASSDERKRHSRAFLCRRVDGWMDGCKWAGWLASWLHKERPKLQRSIPPLLAAAALGLAGVSLAWVFLPLPSCPTTGPPSPSTNCLLPTSATVTAFLSLS
ncbi:hypothetical protein LX32DRAFT_644669 [Colletotrichum zoysiae]|uniref:Uncharacterized protein n=1 Tax=Colletotrichum zoysiae TaxID=1216348 RepID=A0AAD9LZ54_9PEZI|nr:hypothetical protein LX32DRAFT_644669 [Colletotrichum zoysiae]